MQKRKKIIQISLLASSVVLCLGVLSGFVLAKSDNSQVTSPSGQSNPTVLGNTTESVEDVGISNPSPSNISEPNATQRNPSSQGVVTLPAQQSPTNNESPQGGAGTVQTPELENGMLTGNVTTDVGGGSCGNPAGTCTVPLQAKIVIKKTDGTIVSSTISDTSGNFSFTLPAGQYILEPQDVSEVYPSPDPQVITINAYQVTQVDLYYSPMAMTN